MIDRQGVTGPDDSVLDMAEDPDVYESDDSLLALARLAMFGDSGVSVLVFDGDVNRGIRS